MTGPLSHFLHWKREKARAHGIMVSKLRTDYRKTKGPKGRKK